MEPQEWVVPHRLRVARLVPFAHFPGCNRISA
jgi:hypothetical protein